MLMRIIQLILIFMVFASCIQCTSTRNVRKGCKGQGSWYGKRNLSYQLPIIDEHQTSSINFSDSKENGSQ